MDLNGLSGQHFQANTGIVQKGSAVLGVYSKIDASSLSDGVLNPTLLSMEFELGENWALLRIQPFSSSVRIALETLLGKDSLKACYV